METPEGLDPLEFIAVWAQNILDSEEDKGSGCDPDYYEDMLN